MLPQGNYPKLLLLLPSHLLLLQLLLWANTRTTTTTSAAATMHRLIASGAIARNTLLLQAQQQQQQKSDEEFVQFLKYVRQEQNYSTIVLLAANDGKDNCVNMAQMMAQVLQRPLLLLNEQQQFVLLKMSINNNFLMVVCMRHAAADNRSLLRALSVYMLYQREKRIIFRMPPERSEFLKEHPMGENLEEKRKILKKRNIKILEDHSLLEKTDCFREDLKTPSKERVELMKGDAMQEYSLEDTLGDLTLRNEIFGKVGKLRNRMKLQNLDTMENNFTGETMNNLFEQKRVYFHKNLKDISKDRMLLNRRNVMKLNFTQVSSEDRHKKGEFSKQPSEEQFIPKKTDSKEEDLKGNIGHRTKLMAEELIDKGSNDGTSVNIGYSSKRNSKLVILKNQLLDVKELFAKDLKHLRELFRYCQTEQMLNVIAVWRNFPTTYYTYTRFPRFRLLRLQFAKNTTTVIFPNRLVNLEGYPIRTLPDQYVPRSWLYTDDAGHQHMGGYCAHFLRLFARHLNATLVLVRRLEIDKMIFYVDMLNYTRAGLIDIPTSLMGPINDTAWAEYSYPYELGDWCILLPVEAQLTLPEIYAHIVDWTVFAVLLSMIMSYTFLLIIAVYRLRGELYQRTWCDVLLNDKAWRGVFGQPFAFNCARLDFFVKWVFFLLFVTGLVVNTVYSVFLQSYMTRPPHKRRISSWADMNQSPLSVLMSRAEYSLVYPPTYAQYKTLFTIIDSFEEFRRARKMPNASFGYPMPSSFLPMVHSQQQYLSQPLVRYSRDLCFVKFYPLFFLLPANSIYRDVLHLFMLRVHELGLPEYWQQSSFRELVALGRMSHADWIVPHLQRRALSLLDIISLFACLLFMLALSCLVFVAELVVGRQQLLMALGAQRRRLLDFCRAVYVK